MVPLLSMASWLFATALTLLPAKLMLPSNLMALAATELSDEELLPQLPPRPPKPPPFPEEEP